ncbi:MAG TPA: polysaccharide biosynthesis tyrosine autokinase [Terriglobales bacterium]|jgi:exopolysaccharide transport family protein|nr:polysaccharide biosynthesis tyrosine autokinase [Terriglobales bacterium]
MNQLDDNNYFLGVRMDSGPLIPVNGQVLRDVSADLPIEMNRLLGSSAYSGLPLQDSALREYVRVLIKRKWLVLGCVAVIFGVVALATMRSTRIYDATGSIAINKNESALLNFKDSPNGAGSDYYDPTDLDTEVRILKSDLLALQVIRQLNLDKQPEFGGGGDSSNTLGLTTDALQPDSEKTTALLANFKAGLRVSLVPNTRIIEIHYRSADKNLAANAVNTLISTYIEQNFKTRFESTMQASDWLSKQLVDLEMKVQTSQEKLVLYQKQHEILGIDEKQNIITSKLDELNKELTAAESDRMGKESVYRLVESGDPDTAAAAAVSAGASGGASGGSSLMEKMREQQADLKIQVAQLTTQFGNSYPKVMQLNNQLKEVDAQLQTEMTKVVSRVRSGYLASLQHESMLRAALDKQKQEANQLNESAIEYSLLKRDVESYRTLYEGLMEKLKEAGVTAGLKSNNIRNVDKARVPTYPSEPNVPRNLAFALALGMTTGIGLAFLLEGIDNTVRTPEQAQAISALPSLGMIPMGSKNSVEAAARRLTVASSREAVELVTQARPQSQMAESYRALRTSLLLTSLGAPPKVILITSALPQEGKTTTSINTAIVLAQKGTRVLLIDADLRRPSIHKTLGMGPKTGLSNVLTGSANLQQAVVRSTIVPTLFVLPAGTPPPNPAELLASSNMKDILAELREEYDHIIVDTPPTLSVTDAVVMSTRADAVVLVIRSGQTTKQALRRSRDILVQVNARVAGVLLNAVDLNSPDYYYYYEYQGKYGHRYYQEDELSDSDSDIDDGAEALPKVSSSGI